MPRRVFPASTVTNTTGAALPLTFYATSTTGRREVDLWTVDGSNNLVERIPNGVILADAGTGAYSAFAGPDDVDLLYALPGNSDSRTTLTATGTVTGGSTVDSAVFAKLWTSPTASTTLTGTLAAWVITAVDCTAGAGARTLLAANSVTAGTSACAKKADTSANNLVVSRAGSDLIYGTGSGATSKTLSLAGEAVEFVSNGVDRWTVRSSDTPSGVLASTYLTQASATTTYAGIGRGLPGGMTFIPTGDSITLADADPSNGLAGNNWATHLCLASGGSLRLAWNAGHGGNTSTQLLALLQSEVLARNPAVVGIGWGTNDTLDGSNKPTTTAANIRAGVAACRAAGAFVFLNTLPPQGMAALAAPAAPTLTGSTTGGTVAANTYYYAATYTNGAGETTIGASANVTTTGSTSSVAVDIPHAEGSSGAKVYISTDNATWHLIGTLTNSGGQTKYVQRYTDTTGSLAGASAPGANGTAIANNTTAQLKIATINAWIREYGRANGVPVVDNYAILVDPTTGFYKTGYTLDGTHPTAQRQKRLGDNAWTAIKSYIPQGQPQITYSQTDPLNLYTNGCYGSGSGTVPTGVTAFGGNASGVSSTNASKTGFSGNAYTVTRTIPDVRFSDSTLTSTGFSVGDTIAVGFMVQAASAETGGGQVTVKIKCNGPNTTPVQLVINATDFGPLPWVATFVVPANTTSIGLNAPYIAYGPIAASVGQVTLYNVTTGGLLL